MLHILYFAWVAERIGQHEETLTPPADITTAGALMAWLSARSAGHRAAFAEPEMLRIAIDLAIATPDALITNADEIAFFPPVTGG